MPWMDLVASPWQHLTSGPASCVSDLQLQNTYTCTQLFNKTVSDVNICGPTGWLQVSAFKDLIPQSEPSVRPNLLKVLRVLTIVLA